MVTTLRRYLRAFALALRFTLRGDKPPLLQVNERYPQLAAWWQKTITLLDALDRSAAANGIDQAALRVRVDKREISMTTILATVRYHAEREYPHLMAYGDQYNSLTLQALNLNDRHLVQSLIERVPPTIKPEVEAFAAHLETFPS
jgi:hypothetical protein